MRRLTSWRNAAIVAALAALITSACGRGRIQGETIEESGGGVASIIHTADPATATQLLRGFHDVEQNAWRWTQGRFSVALRPPAGAAQKGAALVLKFSVPGQVIERVSTLTLSASAEGAALLSETYSRPGDYTYRRDVPAASLSTPVTTVDFSLDKSLPRGTLDQRELGIVVSTVGFEAK